MERAQAQSFEHRGSVFAWDPARARLTLRYGPEVLDAADADVLVPRITTWVDSVPFATFLVDARELREAPLGWRNVWMGWFRERRASVRTAIFGAKRLDDLTIPVFAWLSGADIRTFDDEAAAEAWLEEVSAGLSRRGGREPF